MSQINHDHNLFWFAWFLFIHHGEMCKECRKFIFTLKNALDFMNFKKDPTCNKKKKYLTGISCPYKSGLLFFYENTI